MTIYKYIKNPNGNIISMNNIEMMTPVIFDDGYYSNIVSYKFNISYISGHSVDFTYDSEKYIDSKEDLYKKVCKIHEEIQNHINDNIQILEINQGINLKKEING